MYKNALKEDFIRVVENLDGTVESTDTIFKLKTKIENSSTFESDPDFVKTLIQNCIDERVYRKTKERARRLSCSEKLQVNNQIDDWLRQGIIKESVFDYCSPIVLCKKANGAMKTSSVEFISRSPTPSPMERNYRRFVLLRRIFEPWQWKRRKRECFEQTSRTLRRKISMRRQPKINLLKKTPPWRP
ncbi:hypothetical protein TNCV_4742371 [Trichonephila clavipes]|nr:hypothetical protein TNCV_4742371 [Trichonephila clavipes]